MKIYFATFTDDRYKPTREKARRQAEEMGIFDKVFALSEHDFDAGFKDLFYKEHRDKMFAFGFYCWQPWTDMHVLDQMEDGDILFYSDAGNTLNPNGKKKFMEWVNLISTGEKDVLALRHSEFLECEYTKEDVFKYLEIDNNSDIRETGQYFLGALMIRKSPSSYDLIKKWFDINCNHFEIIDETMNYPNDKRFKDFRYGQSVISVMLKKYDGVVTLNYDNVFRPNKTIEGIEDAPFWAFRTKEITLRAKLVMLPKRIVNKICRVFGLKTVYKLKI